MEEVPPSQTRMVMSHNPRRFSVLLCRRREIPAPADRVQPGTAGPARDGPTTARDRMLIRCKVLWTTFESTYIHLSSHFGIHVAFGFLPSSSLHSSNKARRLRDKIGMKLAQWLALATLVQAKRPNILFILTDDQDLHMESVQHMQYLKVRLTTAAAAVKHGIMQADELPPV